MTEIRLCPECREPLPKHGKHGICPACFLAEALASRTMNSQTEETDPGQPPTPEEIAGKFPQFEIVECLGRGGMGVVYKAKQKSLDRWIAIKILAPERVHEEHFAERFEREAKTLAKMNHPNIVTVYDHGQTEGLFYIVMEFVDGVNLRDLLRDGKMVPEQALAIVPPICEALEFAHEAGVVHRDIKPENLLLDRNGRVKIADFGIASLVGSDDEKSGTPPYMAPEQESGTVDRRSDIYALGAVLYEMLTGERPDKDLVAPSRRVEIDVKIDEMVLRALEKQPERRYQTAAEFRTAAETLGQKTNRTTVRPPAPESEPVQPPPLVDTRKWRQIRILSTLGLLIPFVGWGLIVAAVKIVPQFEEIWMMQEKALSTDERLLLGTSHFIQRIWPFIALFLIALAAASIFGISVSAQKIRNSGYPEPEPRRSTVTLSNLAIFLAFLSVLIPIIFYCLRRLNIPFLIGGVELMIWTSLAVFITAIVAIILGFFSKNTSKGRTAFVVGGISLTVCILCFAAGQIAEQKRKENFTRLFGFVSEGVSEFREDWQQTEKNGRNHLEGRQVYCRIDLEKRLIELIGVREDETSAESLGLRSVSLPAGTHYEIEYWSADPRSDSLKLQSHLESPVLLRTPDRSRPKYIEEVHIVATANDGSFRIKLSPSGSGISKPAGFRGYQLKDGDQNPKARSMLVEGEEKERILTALDARSGNIRTTADNDPEGFPVHHPSSTRAAISSSETVRHGEISRKSFLAIILLGIGGLVSLVILLVIVVVSALLIKRAETGSDWVSRCALGILIFAFLWIPIMMLVGSPVLVLLPGLLAFVISLIFSVCSWRTKLGRTLVCFWVALLVLSPFVTGGAALWKRHQLQNQAHEERLKMMAIEKEERFRQRAILEKARE